MSEKERESGLESAPTLEEHFAGLEKIIGKLEQTDIPLDQAFEMYKEGLDMVKAASAQLNTIEKFMLVMTGDGELEELHEH